MDNKKIKVNKTMIILIPIIIILIAVIGVMGYMLLNKSDETEKESVDTSGRGTVITPDNVDEIREEMSKPVEDGYFETEMNVNWAFPNSKSESTNAYVGNSESNTRTIYFDVVLNDTEEVVYSSPYIPVGASIKGFALNVDLSKGTYPARCQYYLVDDNNEVITGVSIDVTLEILD